MSSQPEPGIVEPLVVVEEGQVLFFEDVITVESYMEPSEVRRGVYAAYDTTGQRLEISIASRQEDGLLEVPAEYITLAPANMPAQADELHALLVEHFVQAGTPRDALRSATLSELVERGLNEARGTHEHGPLFIVEIGREIVRGLRGLTSRGGRSPSS
jgi:hypothetical protein